MALKDLIAQAGPQLYETMRKGWLPTQEEQQARSLKDLQIQSVKSELAYQPTKRRLKERTNESNIIYQKVLMKKHEADAARLKTESDKKLYVEKQKAMGQHFREANKLNTIKKKKVYLQRYRDDILDDGDDKQDAAFKAVLNMSGEQFNESFGLVLQGNEYIQGLNDKRFGKATTLQSLETGDIKTVLFNDSNYQTKVDDALMNDYVVTKTMGIEQQGTASSMGLNDRRLKREIINEQSAIETANFIGGRTIDLITKSSEALGVTGGFARIATSLKSQIDSAAKLAGTSWKPDTSFDPGSYRKIFQDAGIDNVVVRGNLTQLARMLATSSGEGKVLSDPDMKRWLNVVAVGNGDPKTVAAAIRNALEIQNFRFRQKYRNSTGKDYEGDLFFPKEQAPDVPLNIQSLMDEKSANLKRIEELKNASE